MRTRNEIIPDNFMFWRIDFARLAHRQSLRQIAARPILSSVASAANATRAGYRRAVRVNHARHLVAGCPYRGPNGRAVGGLGLLQVDRPILERGPIARGITGRGIRARRGASREKQKHNNDCNLAHGLKLRPSPPSCKVLACAVPLSSADGTAGRPRIRHHSLPGPATVETWAGRAIRPRMA